MLQLLQNASILLQNASLITKLVDFITKYDSYYKMRPYKCSAINDRRVQIIANH